MSKSGKAVKTKSKATGFSESIPTLFAMGNVDLIFKLNLTDKDLEKPTSDENQGNEQKEEKGKKGEDDKHYKIEDINSIKDLEFIKEKKEIWDKIVLSGGNDTIKQLIIGNKTSKKKCRIDYIGYGRPTFEGEEEFFDEIYNYVTAKNHLNINKTPLNEEARSSLTIILVHKGKTQTISVGKSQEEEDKENKKKKKKPKKEETNEKKEKNEKKKKDKKGKKEEGEEEEEEEEEEEDDEEDDDEEEEEKNEEDYEETEAMKEKKIPKFKRFASVLLNLEPAYSKYEMAYINYADLKNIPGDFKMRDLLELLRFFKNKGTTIFVNFYKPKKKKIPDEPEEPEDNHEDDNAIMGEGKSKETQKEKPEEEPEEKKEKKEKKKREGPSKKMIELNQLYDFTNIFFYDIRQCNKIFNKHYETFTEDNIYNRKKITRSKIFDYFIKGIATATKQEVTGMKTGLFIDELNKFSIIYASKKAANKQEFDCQPHPKVNHTNLDLIKEYKKILKENKNDNYSILLSNIIISCAANAPNCQSTEVLYPAFLISLEIIKKKLEIEKNKLEIDDNIYKVKVSEKAILKDLEKFASGGKEDGFVLDCTNKQKSTMKDYVSLYDYHLKTFFSSEYIRKDLKSKGFINTKGFIMYDPVHRSVMGKKQEKKKKKVTDEEMKTKLMSSIQGINVPSNIKDKEIDAQKLAKNQNVPTEAKLPFSKETLETETTKKKRRKKRKKRENSSGGSSEEYSSGNNSGTDSGEESSGTVEKTEG